MSIATVGPTATVFNNSYFPQPESPKANLPPTLRRIAIVGGGSAGWMTAMLLVDALGAHGVEIDVLESPTVAIGGDGPALHPAHGDGVCRIPARRRPGRRGAGALQPARQRAIRRHPRLHRQPLQDQLAQRYRLLARLRR